MDLIKFLMKTIMETSTVLIDISAPGLKRIIDWGTKKYGTDHINDGCIN